MDFELGQDTAIVRDSHPSSVERDLAPREAKVGVTLDPPIPPRALHGSTAK